MANKVDTKEGSIFSATALAFVRSMFPAGKEYRFDMVASTTVGTNASGSLQQALAFSPAVVSYQEWAALSALFEEVVLIRAQCSFLPLIGSDGQILTTTTASKAMVNDVVVGANPDNISTAPSFSSVIRLAKSVSLARTIADISGPTMISYRPPPDRPYARTATPAVQDPPAGMVGSFDIANATALTVSIPYYSNVLRVVVSLRNRS